MNQTGTGTEKKQEILVPVLMTSVNISTAHCTFHLVPVLVPFPCSVTKPSNCQWYRLVSDKWVENLFLKFIVPSQEFFHVGFARDEYTRTICSHRLPTNVSISEKAFAAIDLNGTVPNGMGFLTYFQYHYPCRYQ